MTRAQRASATPTSLVRNETDNSLSLSESVSSSVVFSSLRSHGLQPARLLCPWNSFRSNAGVDCHFLQIFSPLRIFKNQCLLHSVMAGRFFGQFGHQGSLLFQGTWQKPVSLTPGLCCSHGLLCSRLELLARDSDSVTPPPCDWGLSEPSISSPHKAMTACLSQGCHVRI